MKSATRDQILAEALPLFLEQGVAGATVDEIRKAAGVSNGSLFHFFANKDAIAVALYVDAIASYHTALLEEIEQERDARLSISGLVEAHWNWVETHEAQARFLFEMGRPSWHAEAEIHTREMNGRLEAAYGRWWNRQVELGTVHPLPLAVTRSVVLGPSMMALRHWLREGGGPPHKLVAYFADSAVRALVKGDV